MSNPFDDILRALSEAREIQAAADGAASAMASLLRGRLCHVDKWKLQDLKRELRNFNMITGEWKESK